MTRRGRLRQPYRVLATLLCIRPDTRRLKCCSSISTCSLLCQHLCASRKLLVSPEPLYLFERPKSLVVPAAHIGVGVKDTDNGTLQLLVQRVATPQNLTICIAECCPRQPLPRCVVLLIGGLRFVDGLFSHCRPDSVDSHRQATIKLVDCDAREHRLSRTFRNCCYLHSAPLASEIIPATRIAGRRHSQI